MRIDARSAAILALAVGAGGQALSAVYPSALLKVLSIFALIPAYTWLRQAFANEHYWQDDAPTPLSPEFRSRYRTAIVMAAIAGAPILAFAWNAGQTMSLIHLLLMLMFLSTAWAESQRS